MGAAPDWLARARQQACQPWPAQRWPLLLQSRPIGSLDARIADKILSFPTSGNGVQLLKTEHDGQPAWQLTGPSGTPGQAGGPAGDGTAWLNALAQLLRRAGCCGPWRDEQVAVCDAQGRRLARVERGALRVLGVATQAVHLVGCTPDGARLWLQQRAANKPTHPGAWDTLMGGLVAAADSVEQALARETWEEAGLRLAQLHDLRPGGQVLLAHPSDEGGPGCGWMAERVWWFRAALAPALQPQNQDGEVQAFACLPHAQVQQRLAAGAFTPEAALVLADFYGW